MSLSPSEAAAVAPFLKGHTWGVLLEALNQPSYQTRTEGKRTFTIPSRTLAQAHKAFNALARLKLPPPAGMHALLPEVEAELPHYPVVLRGDIRKCFDSILKSPALAAFHDWLAQAGFSPAAQAFLQKGAASLFSVDQGISTGSPASPALLDCLFTRIELCRKGCRVWRYVDDLMGLAPTTPEGEALLNQWRATLKPFGWQLAGDKTALYGHDQPFLFLGHMFNDPQGKPAPDFVLDPRKLYPFKAFTPELRLRQDPRADSYQRTRTFIAYSAFSLPDQIMKGSVEALLLAWGAYMQGTAILRKNLNGALCQPMLSPLHATLWKGYTRNVKTPRDKGEPVNHREAERILIALALVVFLAAEGRFPTTVEEMESSLAAHAQAHPKARNLSFNLKDALDHAPQGNAAYHDTIKALFKLEWQFREGGQHVLPATAPLMNALVAQDTTAPTNPLTSALL